MQWQNWHTCNLWLNVLYLPWSTWILLQCVQCNILYTNFFSRGAGAACSLQGIVATLGPSVWGVLASHHCSWCMLWLSMLRYSAESVWDRGLLARSIYYGYWRVCQFLLPSGLPLVEGRLHHEVFQRLVIAEDNCLLPLYIRSPPFT